MEAFARGMMADVDAGMMQGVMTQDMDRPGTRPSIVTGPSGFIGNEYAKHRR